MPQPVGQDPADKSMGHRRFAAATRIYKYSLNQTDIQLIRLQIIRASTALPDMLREGSAKRRTQVAVKIGANRPDELAASHFVTRHGL